MYRRTLQSSLPGRGSLSVTGTPPMALSSSRSLAISYGDCGEPVPVGEIEELRLESCAGHEHERGPEGYRLDRHGQGPFGGFRCRPDAPFWAR